MNTVEWRERSKDSAFRISQSALLAVAVFSLLPGCISSPARNIDRGTFVGDGQVRLDAPYDPGNVHEVTFVSPTSGYPYFEIVIPLGDWSEGSHSAVHSVHVNDVECDSYNVFVDGNARAHGQTINRGSTSAKNVVVVARSLWHSGESTTIAMELGATGEDGKGKTLTKQFTATAPATGGAPAGCRRYQSFNLTETAGVDRVNEPVEFSITERADLVHHLEHELVVCEVNDKTGELTPVRFEVFNAQQHPGTPPGNDMPWVDSPLGYPNHLYYPTTSVEVVMLANVKANTRKAYIVLYDHPGYERGIQAGALDLEYAGNRWPSRVRTPYYAANLSSKSGCIASIQLPVSKTRPNPPFTNSFNGALHWNPDSYGDNGRWGHVFAWNPPDEVHITSAGDLMQRVTLAGRMPGETPQIHVSVTYTFYADVPYIRTTTVTEVRDPYHASAIRNGELVLDTHLVDHFVWEEKSGEVHKIETLHGPNFQDEWTTRVDHDVHWLAMTSETDGYGIGVAVANSHALNAKSGKATTHRPAYYLYYHQQWDYPLTYFTRAWVYPFSDYQRGPSRPVAPGSTYVEDTAIVPFSLYEGPARYHTIQTASVQLRHPLQQRWGR